MARRRTKDITQVYIILIFRHLDIFFGRVVDLVKLMAAINVTQNMHSMDWITADGTVFNRC